MIVKPTRNSKCSSVTEAGRQLTLFDNKLDATTEDHRSAVVASSGHNSGHARPGETTPTRPKPNLTIAPDTRGGESGENRTPVSCNDCKGEIDPYIEADWLAGSVGGFGKREGMVPPQEEKMATITDIENVVNRMQRTGDQTPIRIAIRLMRHTGLSPHEFAVLSRDGVIGCICAFRIDVEQRRLNGCAPKECFIPSEMADAKRLANRIEHALHQLYQQFPDRGFPPVPEPLGRSRSPYRFSDEGPHPRLKRELEEWKPQLYKYEKDENGIELQCDATEPGSGAPIANDTMGEYITKTLQVTTLCVKAKIRIGRSFGIEYMTDPETVVLWLPLLEAHYSNKNCAPTLAGIKRIASDILGKDHPNVVALAAVQRDASKRYQNKGLTAKEVEERRDQTRPEAALDRCQIWDLPDRIDAMSEQRCLSLTDKDGRKACAVAADIVLCTPSIAPAHLAQINFKLDVRSSAERREIRSVDHNGAESWVELPEAVCHRIDRLVGFRLDNRLETPFLFAGRVRTEPQQRRVAMTGLARCLSAALGTRIMIKDMRDSLLINLVDNGTDDPKTLGDAVGLDPRTIQRRLRIVLDNPLAPANEEPDDKIKVDEPNREKGADHKKSGIDGDHENDGDDL